MFSVDAMGEADILSNSLSQIASESTLRISVNEKRDGTHGQYGLDVSAVASGFGKKTRAQSSTCTRLRAQDSC